MLEDITLKDQDISKPEEIEADYFCSIKPDEVPPIPENKFLMRGAPESTASKKEQETKPDEKQNDHRDRDRAEQKKYKDAVGRKVKGRGALRYNGRSRSRSRTPPHWRRANEDRQRFSYQNQAYSSSFGQAKAQTFVRSKDEEIKKEVKKEDDSHRDYRERDRDYDRDRRNRGSQERYEKKRDDSGKFFLIIFI